MSRDVPLVVVGGGGVCVWGGGGGGRDGHGHIMTEPVYDCHTVGMAK